MTVLSVAVRLLAKAAALPLGCSEDYETGFVGRWDREAKYEAIRPAMEVEPEHSSHSSTLGGLSTHRVS
jgi:hypothetical protein